MISPPVLIEKGSAGPKQARAAALPPVDTHMDYVRDNLIATLYHELAHALIDTMKLPVLGQEEDAADVLSTLLIHERHAEEEATRMVRNAANGFAGDAKKMEDHGADWDMSDDHGPHRQRYYNIVCIFYGANPAARAGFAEEMGLPEERAQKCEGEYELASASWSAVLDRLKELPQGATLGFQKKPRTQLDEQAGEAISATIERLNEIYQFPAKLRVVLKLCGSRDKGYDAFYIGDRKKITICTEYVRDLYRAASGEL